MIGTSIFGKYFFGDGGFSPPDIPNLSLWLDPSDAATVIETGPNVTQWNDKSSNGFNQTAYLIGGATGPTYSLSGINNLNAINTSSYFFGNVLSDLITSSEGTIFAVYKFSTEPRPTGPVADKDSILGAESSIGITVSNNYDANVYNNDGSLVSLSFSSDIPPPVKHCYVATWRRAARGRG